MDYDPIKDLLGKWFGTLPALQRIFFAALHLIFLRAWYVRRALRKYLTEDSSVLDAGTGFAQYAYWVARRYPRAQVTATDIKEDYLTDAQRFFAAVGLDSRVRFVRDDLTHPSATGPFDCIMAVDVLEHIEDDQGVLAHFCQQTKPGGHVIISTPSNLGGSDVHESGENSFIGEHVRSGYSVEELESKVCGAGFCVAERHYSYGRYGSAAWRMLVKVPVLALGRWRASLIVLLPVYYIVAMPIGLLLNWIDLSANNESGTGVLLVARKPVEGDAARSSQILSDVAQ